MPPRSVDVDQVLALIRFAEQVDGFSALNEAASLRLRHQEPDTETFLHTAHGLLVGYGQLDRSAPGPTEASLVVHPDHRRRGHGRALLNELLAADPRLEIWAVHATVAAAALAADRGLRAVRELMIMSRPLLDPVVPVPPPAGVIIRAFRPGADEEAWLGVNSRAFAHHPEQGRLTIDDLRQRMAEPWFDPAGFLLADRGGEVVGFHWTKQHPGRVGEVYVLGVDPAAGVRGLGRVLLAAGLEHLRAAGDTEVLLYVDGTNTRAAQLYERAGFAVASRDIQYAGMVGSGPALATMQETSAPLTDSPQEIA
jgi:mycothiol synthase